MIAFNEWLANIEEAYPKYQNKDGYCIGNTPALKAGWGAALEWARIKLENYTTDDVLYFIDKELHNE